MTQKDEDYLKMVTGRRIKQFRQFIGVSRAKMAKHITLSPDRLKQFEEGRVASFADYRELLGLYSEYGLNSTFLFSGYGSIFSFKGPLTPVPMYLIAHFLFPAGADIDLLNKVIAILKNPKTRKDIFDEFKRIQLNLRASLNQERSVQ